MQVFHDIVEWRKARQDLDVSTTLGVVMTMGCLHAGHAALLRRSIEENDATLLTIFINPTQFNQSADLYNYPQALDADLSMAKQLGVDFVLVPDEQQMYPDGYTYHVGEQQLSQTMEGVHRPGHFQGMLTVVMKLLHIAQAHHAYFGEKDYQQYQLVKGMAQAFFLPTNIVACETVRESSGLALSSRNTRLSSAQQQHAAQFFACLHSAASASDARDQLRQAGFEVEYVLDHMGRRYGAVVLGGVRLIDNMAL